jgi:hypothetical protein
MNEETKKKREDTAKGVENLEEQEDDPLEYECSMSETLKTKPQ